MTIERVEVFLKRKKTIDYQSMEYGIGLAATLADGEDAKSVRDEMTATLKSEITSFFKNMNGGS